MLHAGLPVGSLFGIRLRVHWSFLFVPAIFAYWGLGSIIALLLATLLITVLIHELGHCFAARALGGKAREILFWPLGGVATTENRTPGQRVLVSLAGPLTHIPLILLCAALLTAEGHSPSWNPVASLQFPPGSFGLRYLHLVYRMQLLLFCLNLLPAYPLDGGQILAGWLASRRSLRATVAIAAGLTALTAIAFYAAEQYLLSFWLSFEAFSLLIALAYDLEGHPIAGLVAQEEPPEKPQETFVGEPCPSCRRPIHPRSQLCVHCDARLPG